MLRCALALGSVTDVTRHMTAVKIFANSVIYDCLIYTRTKQELWLYNKRFITLRHRFDLAWTNVRFDHERFTRNCHLQLLHSGCPRNVWKFS